MRIGLVGCGRWGQNILRDLRALDAEVIVAARSPASADRATKGGASAIVSSIADLGPLDGIVVSTTTSSHYDVLREAIRHYPHTPIYCEKCLTPDVEQAEELHRLAGARLFVMDKWRYHPGIIELARLARAGELGPVRGIRTTRVDLGSPHTDVDPIWILLPHDLSIVLEICGNIPSPYRSVVERIGSQSETNWGMIALLGSDPWIVCHVSACAEKKLRSTTVYFEHAVVALNDAYSGALQIIRPCNHSYQRPEIEYRPIGADMPLKSELKAFLDFISGNGSPPKSSCAEAVEIVRTIDRLRHLAGIGVPW